MAFCHKWDVKNDFAYVLQFFSLISDGLGSVMSNLIKKSWTDSNPDSSLDEKYIHLPTD